jgi:APA family basic amino acid/polyamine antiporter
VKVPERWQRKPGDKVIRRPRVRERHLRRALGIPALFAAGYGDVGSSIYYALGLVALVALGATPIILAIAGVFFIFHTLTYAEGTAMYPEAGGSASFARHSFNDMAGFLAGWALMFSYIITMAISSFAIPSYLSYFWAPLKDSAATATSVAMGIVLFLMIINIIGVRESSFVNVFLAVMDVVIQVTLISLGFALIFVPELLKENIFSYWPSTGNLMFGVAIAAVAFTGVESMSQMAEETRQPEVRTPKALILMIVVVLVLFSGISLVALSAMTPVELGREWATDPVAGIAANLPFEWLQHLFSPLVGVLAATILLVATNAGLLGISRVSFSMGTHRQLPAALSRVHPRFKTPYVTIALFATITLIIQLPGFIFSDMFSRLGGLYAFGSMMAFAMAHLSIIVLRIRKPEVPRPFKLRPNLKFRGRLIPVTAVLGLAFSITVWLVVITSQTYARYVGSAWIILGLGVYILYRRRSKLPLLERAPEIGSQ